MTLDGMVSDSLICLTADGVSVLLDATDGRLPAIVHWGAALPAMDAEQAAALAAAAVPVIGSNNPDVAPRLAVLPEHHTGWTGRPGLAGSRDGRQWSPAFTVTSVLLSGDPVTGYVRGGAERVEFRAADEAGLLGLVLVVQLLETGLLRVRASVTNLAAEPYAVDGLTLALPVPPDADELLDFAGRHNQERVPQRDAVPHRGAPAGEPQRPHGGRQRVRPACGSRGLRLRRRPDPRGAHRVRAATMCTTPSAR